MTLETHLDKAFKHLISDDISAAVSMDQLIASMDLTLLKESPSDEEINHICQLARSYPVAALCTDAHHLNRFYLPPELNLATVVNFPHGTCELDMCIKEIDGAFNQGVKEIDYVIPYLIYLKGNKSEALNQCHAIAKYCKKYGLTLKVILETGAFSDLQSIYQLSSELIETGCDFLKTSTGKITQGASLSAGFAMLSAIKDSGKKCGIKFSGGIKTPEQARNFACLAELILDKKIHKDWFRLGASGLLDVISSAVEGPPWRG